MENILVQITNYLLAQSRQIVVLVVVIAAVSLALKNKSAHIRYLLWLIVLAKCLVPPLLTIPLAILPQEQIQKSISTVPVETPAITAEAIDITATEPAVLSSAAVTEPTILERLAEITAQQWLGFAWVIGVIVFVLVAVIKALRVNRWLRKERKYLPEKLKTEIENFLADLDVKTFPKVWLIDGIGQPFVWGLLRGSIYLPANFAKVDSRESCRSVWGHELSHVLRFDAAVNLLQIIAQGIFWFHPFVWWANRKIRAEREKCCDETAVAGLGVKCKDYSTAIVNTLTVEHKSAQPIPSLAVAGPVKNIEDRIKTIMKPGKKFYKHPSTVVVITVLLLALVAVPTTLALTTKKTGEPTFLLKGTVTDARTGHGIVGAKVGDVERYAGGQQGTVTDSNGNYHYLTWYEEHGIKVEAPGYKAQRKAMLTRLLGTEKEKVINFELTTITNGKSDVQVEGECLSAKTSVAALPGKYALSFDGVDDFLEIHASESLQLGRHFTIQMWIKPEFPDTSTPDKDRNLLSKGGYISGHPDEKGNRRADAYGFGFKLRPEDDSMVALDMSTANGGIYTSTNIFSYKSGWQHLVISSRENSGLSQGINYIHTSQETYKPAPNSNIIIGGKSLIPMGNYFKGQIAELRIWNRELSFDEIAKFKTMALSGNEPNLVGCWTFEQTEGQRAIDISPYKNRARLGSTYGPDNSDPTWVRIGEKENEKTPDGQVEDESKEVLEAAQQLFDNIRSADYEHILSYYKNGKWRRDGWKKLLPADYYYLTRTDFPSWVRWICETFKDNPVVSVELGEVFISDKEIVGLDRKTWPTVPYKLMLKDGGTIEGNLLFRYRPERKRSMFRTTEAYWQGMLGLDWHLQKEPIKKPNTKKLRKSANVQVEGEQANNKDEIQIEARFLLVPVDANEFVTFFEEEKIAFGAGKAEPDYTNLLNAEQTEQLLKLVNANPAAKTLTAPKVRVFDGEETTLRTQETIKYEYTDPYAITEQPEQKELQIGTILQVKPTVQADNKEILLEVDFEHTNLLGFEGGLPQTGITKIKTRILASNGQTLLLGGQQITTKDEQDGRIVQENLLVLIKAEKVEAKNTQAK